MRAITALPLAVVLLLATPAAAETPDDELHFAWLPRKAEPAPPPAKIEVAPPAVERAPACAPAPKPSLATQPKRRQKAWYTRAWSAVVSVVN